MRTPKAPGNAGRLENGGLPGAGGRIPSRPSVRTRAGALLVAVLWTSASGACARSGAFASADASAEIEAAAEARRGEGVRPAADAGFRRAATEHEGLLADVRAGIQGRLGHAGDENGARVLRHLRAHEERLLIELAMIYVSCGRLFPDDDPSPERGNALVERADERLNETREGLTPGPIPPSLFLVRSAIWQERGDPKKAWTCFQRAVHVLVLPVDSSR